MATLNKKNTWEEKTHEGGEAARLTPVQQLERSVLAHMLWEDGFYESGETIADRIEKLCAEVPNEAALIAMKARSAYKLRHVPLLICAALAKLHKLDSTTLTACIQRADEMAEFLAIYWRKGKTPLANQVKRGLRDAFARFDEYQFARYQGADDKIKLRDVLFLAHPKPESDERAALYKRIAEKQLATPDTWEVALSAGADKGETFKRLMSENRLGYMAALRNVRNMQQAGVDKAFVGDYLTKGALGSRALPFRFISAARAVPQWEDIIEPAMMAALTEAPKLPGRTILLVDVSGSMDMGTAGKSQITNMDAACALAILCREVCEDVAVYSFSSELAVVPPRHGFALRDAVVKSQDHASTMLGRSLDTLRSQGATADRIIVFTDEQAHDRVGGPIGKGYIINVASNKNGVGYGDWTHITGFSEAVIEYIRQLEVLTASELQPA